MQRQIKCAIPPSTTYQPLTPVPSTIHSQPLTPAGYNRGYYLAAVRPALEFRSESAPTGQSATHHAGRRPVDPGGMGMATTQGSAKRRRGGASAETDSSGVPALLSREPEAQREYYRKMVEIRLFEEACQRGFPPGQGRRLPPPLHRTGSRRHRLARRLQAGRQDHHRLPRSRPRPAARRHAATR